jgi:hypothetical protein
LCEGGIGDWVGGNVEAATRAHGSSNFKIERRKCMLAELSSLEVKVYATDVGKEDSSCCVYCVRRGEGVIEGVSRYTYTEAQVCGELGSDPAPAP